MKMIMKFIISFLTFIVSCILLYMLGAVSDIPEVYYDFMELQLILSWLLLMLTFMSLVASIIEIINAKK